MLDAVFVPVPAPEALPEFRGKVLGPTLGECDVMPAVVGRQVERVTMIGGDHHAEAIEDVIFAQVFFADPYWFRRARQINLDVVVESVAVDAPLFAHVASFAQSHDDRAK